MKYAEGMWASPWVFANSPIAQTQGPDRGIKIYSIPRKPSGYLPCHMGNNGLHNLDMEMHTFPAHCYSQIKNINADV